MKRVAIIVCVLLCRGVLGADLDTLRTARQIDEVVVTGTRTRTMSGICHDRIGGGTGPD